MRRTVFIITGLVALMLILAGCSTTGPATPTPTPTMTTPGGTGMANPSAVYCQQQNNRYEIRTNPDGSQYGVCILSDGTICDGWAYYQKTCPATMPGMANPAAVFCQQRNNTYQIRTNIDGSQFGVCILSDGTVCDEWAYYQGVCPSPSTMPGMANPAAVFCQQRNNTYQIKTNPNGSQYGVCILSDGTTCDEWAYYQGLCPAPLTTGGSAGMANPSATFCVSKGYTYQIVTNPDGSQAGNCVFTNGKACDGWAYYRGECNETTAK